MSRSAGLNLEAPCLASGAPGLDAGRVHRAEGTARPRVRQPCRGMTRRWRNRAGAHQRRRQLAAHPRPGSQPASGPRRRRDGVAWPRGGDRTTGVGGAPIREQRRGCNRFPSAQDCGARLNCTPLVSSPGLHLGARGRLFPARAPSAPAPEESPRSCATTSAVPPTSTSTAGTGLAIVCVSKTSNLVQSTTNLKMCNRTKSIVRGVWFPAASAPERCVHRVKPVIRHFGH